MHPLKHIKITLGRFPLFYLFLIYIGRGGPLTSSMGTVNINQPPGVCTNALMDILKVLKRAMIACQYKAAFQYFHSQLTIFNNDDDNNNDACSCENGNNF